MVTCLSVAHKMGQVSTESVDRKYSWSTLTGLQKRVATLSLKPSSSHHLSHQGLLLSHSSPHPTPLAPLSSKLVRPYLQPGALPSPRQTHRAAPSTLKRGGAGGATTRGCVCVWMSATARRLLQLFPPSTVLSHRSSGHARVLAVEMNCAATAHVQGRAARHHAGRRRLIHRPCGLAAPDKLHWGHGYAAAARPCCSTSRLKQQAQKGNRCAGFRTRCVKR